MGAERVDYYSDEEFQQALQHEQQMQNQEEQEPDQIEMMNEHELRQALREEINQHDELRLVVQQQRRGEFICTKCGLRQDEHVDKNDIPF